MKNHLAAILGLGLAVSVASLAVAAEGSVSVKPGVGAETAGKCVANIAVFSQMAQLILKKESPENKAMSEAWTNYIALKDSAFVQTAADAIRATGARYSKAKEQGDDALATVLSQDFGECVGYLQNG